MQRILLTKLLQYLPGREFDGSVGVVDVFSQRLAANFDGNEGAMFSRQYVQRGAFSDSNTRQVARMGDIQNSVSVSKGAATNTVAVQRIASGASNQLLFPHLIGNEFYAHGLAWSVAENELVHIKPDGSEEIAPPGLAFGAFSAAFIGGATTGSEIWRGKISHVVVFFEYLSESQRAAMYSIFHSGKITAEYIDISVSRNFVLWTLYPYSQVEEWGSNTIL